MTRTRWAAAGVAVAVVLAGGWLLLRGGPPAFTPDAGRQTAERFLADVRAGRPDQAWQTTSAEFKSLTGRDTFRALVKSKPVLRQPVTFDRCDRSDRNGLPLAECVFRGEKGGTVRVTLAPDGGEWKVERVSVE